MTRKVRTGDLLVAAAGEDENWFSRSVVFVLDADEGGALGVVLNKLSDVPLGAVLPDWADQVDEPRQMFAGGPVSTDGAICLASPVAPGEEPPGWRPVIGRVGLLHLDTPLELVAGAYRHLRIYAGYSGWEPGQLEGELAAGTWHVVRGRRTDVFTREPEGLWREVLRRQPLDLAIWSTWPDDPDLN